MFISELIQNDQERKAGKIHKYYLITLQKKFCSEILRARFNDSSFYKSVQKIWFHAKKIFHRL